MTDRELLAEYVRSGSERAFAGIIARHGAMVYSTCRRVLGDHAAAEDATQAAFLVLVRKARGLDGASLTGWLFRTAENAARVAGRARARRARHEQEAAMTRGEQTPREAHWEEIAPQIDAALATLSSRQANVVAMRILENRPQAEVARELGCSGSTVSSLLSRALDALRARLARHGVTLSAAALGAMLGRNAVAPVPAGMAESVAAVCAGQAATSPAVLALTGGVMKGLFWLKVKTAALLAGAVLTVGAAGGLAAMRFAAGKPDRGGRGAAVVDPHVTTDQSVDCRTVDSILESLIKPDMTDEEKVLAVFHWLRRMIAHGYGEQDVETNYNFHYAVQVYGLGSCLRQTTPLSVLWERLGYQTRNWAVGDHPCIQVFYGGKWHLLDPHMNFYVYDRGTPRSIASIEQIKEDLTLVSDAVKEGRACPGFLLCGDSIGTFATKTGWKDMGKFPESRRYRPRIVEPFGGIALRRGESYVRTWAVGQYWVQKYCAKTGPYHTCGERDEQDTVNFPILEPHVWAGEGFRRYRHGAVGRLVYAPDLTGDHYADAVVSRTNLGPGGIAGAKGLVPTETGKPGEVVFSVNCPYPITAGELKLERLGTGDLQGAVSTDEGKTWKPVELKAEGNLFSALFIEEVNGSTAGYRLKLAVPAGAGIGKMELVSHFQLNARSLPYLVPGKNVVKVEAATFGSPLTLTWNWGEGPEWKTPKTLSKTFTASGTVEVEVGGPKYPRMESLVLSVAP